MNQVYIKTGVAIVGSIIITFVLMTFLFENNTPTVKPGFSRFVNRVTNTIVGSPGEPVLVGIDPTPPPTIYY